LPREGLLLGDGVEGDLLLIGLDEDALIDKRGQKVGNLLVAGIRDGRYARLYLLDGLGGIGRGQKLDDFALKLLVLELGLSLAARGGRLLFEQLDFMVDERDEVSAVRYALTEREEIVPLSHLVSHSDTSFQNKSIDFEGGAGAARLPLSPCLTSIL